MIRWLLSLAFVLTSSTAHAWICTRVTDNLGVESGPSLSWPSRTVSYSLHHQGTADITDDDEFDALRASFSVWADAQECAAPNRNTDLDLRETPHLSTTDRIGFDFLAPEENENLLIFRDSGWSEPGQASLIIALTTSTFNSVTGDIFDSDIEFNSANFAFTARNNSAQTDLMNTAVHEIGHLLGLGHPPVAEATMYARAEVGELSKRDLACDDLNAIVFKYPAAGINGYCATVTASCGFCAPPSALTTIATVSVSDIDNGQGGCASTAIPENGRSLSSLLYVLLGVLLPIRFRRSPRHVDQG